MLVQVNEWPGDHTRGLPKAHSTLDRLDDSHSVELRRVMVGENEQTGCAARLIECIVSLCPLLPEMIT